MFQALLCPSSGTRACDVVYHIGRVFLGLLYVGGEVRLGWSSVRVAGLSLQRMCILCTECTSVAGHSSQHNITQHGMLPQHPTGTAKLICDYF